MAKPPTLTLADALNELQNWSSALANTVQAHREEILDTLENLAEPILPNAPSRASQAELVFRQIKSRFGEVSFMVQAVEDAIWAHPNAKKK